MKTYDVRCPACGRINHSVYLEETGGWMECDHCRRVSWHGERIHLAGVTAPRMGQAGPAPAGGRRLPADLPR